jgi:DNA-binding CsgD family transcriptional regulator
MLDRDQHNDLIARVYASALGQASWVDTMRCVSNAFHSSASLCQIADSSFRYVIQENHGYSRDFAEWYYASEAFANDPRPPYFRSVRPGSIYYDHALFDVDEMYRNPIVRESCDILGVSYQLGMVVPLPNQHLGTFTLLSTEEEGHASHEAIEAFQRLLPHVEQALSLGHTLQFGAAKEAVLLDALAHKADGVIMLARGGAPTFMNDTASRILASGDGLSLTAGALRTARAPETRRLQNLIGAALETWLTDAKPPGGQILITRPSGRRPYVVRVMPAPPGPSYLLGSTAACVLHIHDLGAVRVPAPDTLHSVFGLSEREADLAIELVRCANLQTAAANARMALNTARNHLQSIFRKTGVSSQAEAVQLFSTGF